MTEEYRQALEALEIARNHYNLVNKEFEEVAFRELQAAEARVMAIINSFRKEVTSDEKALERADGKNIN